MKRKLILILICIFALLLVSCSGESGEKVATTEFADWQSYVIVRPDTADESTVKAATTLVKALQEYSGVKPELTTDWVKRGEAAPTGTKEILIGATNRPESVSGLRCDDYVVKFENGRLSISGGSGEAVIAGVEWYIANCITDKVSYPNEPKTYEGSYPLAAVKLNGVALSEYKVNENCDFPELAKQLSDYIYRGTGLKPAGKEHMIELVADPALSIFDAEVKTANGGLMLAVGESGVDMSVAYDMLMSAIENRNGDDITINERKTIEMDNFKKLDDKQIKEWRDESDARIEKILSSPNMEIPAGKTVYYVSPKGDDFNDGKSPEKAWKSLEAVNTHTLDSGSYVCFERGGLWRGQLEARAGITYTAYGEGDKPKIYRSPFDAADPTKWTKTDAENIWSIKLDKNDVGTLVFNHGEAHAIKCVIRTETDGKTYNNTTGEPFVTYADLTTDLHFFHDYYDTGILYLYSKENPGERFDSIEINKKTNVIAVKGNGVTIDNLCIKYGGSHGVGAGTVKDLTVQNCEFGWIGGSIQSEGIFGRNYGTRYGNAVEIYGGCENFDVTDNYIYQVYDAGITQQVGLDSKVDNIKHQKNMYYARNVIEYCNYSIEYFLSGCVEQNPSRMENFVIEDNYMWYAGYGFCEQRPDGNQGAHIKGWSGSNRNRATGYVIKDNLMFDGNDMLVQICSGLYNPDGSDSMPELSNNQFVGHIGMDFGTIHQTDNSRVAFGASNPTYIEEHTIGGDIFWLLEK